MIVSRPKTVMNHGIPAAGSGPGPSPARRRSAARSATDRANEWRSSSDVVLSRGSCSDHASNASRTRARSVPNRRSMCSGWSTAPSRETATSTRTSQDARGASVTGKRTTPARPIPVRERTSCVRPLRPSPSSRTTRPARSSKCASAGGGSSGAWSGSPSAKSCCLTLMMSAKSVAKSSSTVKAIRSPVSLRITMWSCIPSPTKRWRAIERTSWSRSPASGLRM